MKKTRNAQEKPALNLRLQKGPPLRASGQGADLRQSLLTGSPCQTKGLAAQGAFLSRICNDFYLPQARVQHGISRCEAFCPLQPVGVGPIILHRCSRSVCGCDVLRAGCNSLPAVKRGQSSQARERLLRQGQQIRCNSGADGHSPDERERKKRDSLFVRNPGIRLRAKSAYPFLTP